MNIKNFLFLFILLTSIPFVSAEETPEGYQLNFIYDGKNLLVGSLSKEASYGTYRVELISSSSKVVETSKFVIINNLSQTIKIFIPYSKEGILINIYYPNDTLMFDIDVSQYAGPESTSIPFVSANETPDKYQLNFTYDGKNFKSVELSVIFPELQLNFIYDEKNLSSIINCSREAPFGSYKVELISSGGLVVEADEFSINDNLPQTIKVLIPYSEDGILLNIHYPNDTLMFGIGVSQYAGPEYQNISKNVSKEMMQNISNAEANKTYMKQYEEKYQTAKKWFTILVIVCVIIVGIMLLYTWKYKMAR